MKLYKETIKRTLRTFLQAAIGYIAMQLVYVVSTNVQDVNLLKNALYGLIVSAVAAGIAAIMNMPKKNIENPEG